MAQIVTMAAFNITSLQVSDLLEDLGQDSIDFKMTIEQDGKQLIADVSYYKLTKYCRVALPEICDYLNKVRSSIVGFGPKETKVWAILQDEGFDILPVLYSFLEANPLHIYEPKFPTTPKQQAKLEEIVNTLSEAAYGLKEVNLRSTAFMDELLALLTNKILEHYPEIFNSEPEYIKEVQGILINTIYGLTEQLSKLSYKARQT